MVDCALAKSVTKEPNSDAKIHALYRKVLTREPTSSERDLAAEFFARPLLVAVTIVQC